MFSSLGEQPGDNDTSSTGKNAKSDAVENFMAAKWKSLPTENKEDIKTISISFLFALLVRFFIVEPRFIPSLSMFPTFDIGDQLLVEKVTHFSRNYQKRDVVVFNPSQTYVDLTGNTEALIKRIVAVEGDTVQVKGHRLYVNGVLQEEPYTNEFPDYELDPTQVPAGMLLVLGDNRNHSFDSHIWGFLPEKNVIGRAVVRYWPPWRVGLIEGGM
jgi:signal peptidase I